MITHQLADAPVQSVGDDDRCDISGNRKCIICAAHPDQHDDNYNIDGDSVSSSEKTVIASNRFLTKMRNSSTSMPATRPPLFTEDQLKVFSELENILSPEMKHLLANMFPQHGASTEQRTVNVNSIESLLKVWNIDEAKSSAFVELLRNAMLYDDKMEYLRAKMAGVTTVYSITLQPNASEESSLTSSENPTTVIRNTGRSNAANALLQAGLEQTTSSSIPSSTNATKGAASDTRSYSSGDHATDASASDTGSYLSGEQTTSSSIPLSTNATQGSTSERSHEE